MERGGAKDIASILADLRRICNHPRLAPSAVSDDGHGDLDGGDRLVVTPASFPRVADCAYHRLFDSALDYDPFQHVDLNSLNLVQICVLNRKIQDHSLGIRNEVISPSAPSGVPHSRGEAYCPHVRSDTEGVSAPAADRGAARQGGHHRGESPDAPRPARQGRRGRHTPTGRRLGGTEDSQQVCST